MSYYPYYPLSLLKKTLKNSNDLEFRKIQVQQITQEFQNLPEATLTCLPLYHMSYAFIILTSQKQTKLVFYFLCWGHCFRSSTWVNNQSNIFPKNHSE